MYYCINAWVNEGMIGRVMAEKPRKEVIDRLLTKYDYVEVATVVNGRVVVTERYQ